jgi:hypothetical protein
LIESDSILAGAEPVPTRRNNDPRTTFADVRRFFDLLQGRIEGMLESPTSSPQPAANPPTSKVTQADIEIVRRVEAILDSPTKWDRASIDHCQPTAKTVGLYCAFQAASMAVAGKFDALISKTAPIGIMSTHFTPTSLSPQVDVRVYR